MTAKSSLDSFLVDAISMKKKYSFLWVLLIIRMCVFNLKFLSFIYLTTFVSMLFLDEEKGLHAAYFAPISKRSAVAGRYLFALSLFAAVLFVNLLCELIVPFFYAEFITSNVYFYVAMFAVYLILISIEIPFYYWQGYAKARICQYLVVLATALLIIKIVGEERLYLFIGNTSLELLVSLIVASILLLICSLLISTKIYESKDF